MTRTSARQGMIPPYVLFFLLYISRVIVALTNVQSVTVGKINTQLLLSIGLGMLMAMLLSAPIIFCIKRGVYPQDNRLVAVLYASYFVFFCGISVCRFSYFAASYMSVDVSIMFFVILFTIATAYCASMGVEAVGRFAFFCGIIVMVVIISVIIINSKNFYAINLFPLGQDSTGDILANAVTFCANSNEPIMLLALARRTNGNVTKPYLASLVASFLSVLALIGCALGVMGAGASMQPFPIYTLFRLASIGSFSHLDIVHISFWILALVVKMSTLVLVTLDCFSRQNEPKKLVAIAVASGAVALGIIQLLGTDMVYVTKAVSIVGFFSLALIIPVVFLIVRRRKNGAR